MADQTMKHNTTVTSRRLKKCSLIIIITVAIITPIYVFKFIRLAIHLWQGRGERDDKIRNAVSGKGIGLEVAMRDITGMIYALNITLEQVLEFF